jgi:hypothetical protein
LHNLRGGPLPKLVNLIVRVYDRLVDYSKLVLPVTIFLIRFLELWYSDTSQSQQNTQNLPSVPPPDPPQVTLSFVLISVLMLCSQLLVEFSYLLIGTLVDCVGNRGVIQQ